MTHACAFEYLKSLNLLRVSKIVEWFEKKPHVTQEMAMTMSIVSIMSSLLINKASSDRVSLSRGSGEH